MPFASKKTRMIARSGDVEGFAIGPIRSSFDSTTQYQHWTGGRPKFRINIAHQSLRWGAIKAPGIRERAIWIESYSAEITWRRVL